MSGGARLSHLSWRLLEDGAGDAAWNMALDQSLFEAVCQNISPPTLRCYRWARPAVSLGRFQSIERTLDLAACQRLDVDVVRRITGGRGILHGTDLTISIAAPVTALGFKASEAVSVARLYARLSDGFIRALWYLGIETAPGFYHRSDAGRVAPGDCFAFISRADIVDEATGRKVLGSALYLREGFLLQQTSLPLFESQQAAETHATLCRTLFTGAAADYAARDLPVMTDAALANTFVRGFAETLNVEFCPAVLSAMEKQRAEQLTFERYANRHWIQGKARQKTCEENVS